MNLSLKVHHHNGLHLGHLGLQFLWGKVALPVSKLIVAESTGIRQSAGRVKIQRVRAAAGWDDIA